MDKELIGAALLSFGLFLLLVAVIFRMTPQEAAMRWMMRVFVGVGMVSGAVHFGSWGVTQYVWWVSFYSFLSILFVFGIFSIMEASVTLRIFSEIAARLETGITPAELIKHYNKGRIVRRRIARLLYSGELTEHHGIYTRGKLSYFGVREVFFAFLFRMFP